MVWLVSLTASGKDIDHLEVGLLERLKGEVIEKVFPKAHWTIESPEAGENPREFDFLGNAERMGRIIDEYRERASDVIHT